MLNLQQWRGSETSSHGSISTGKPLPPGNNFQIQPCSYMYSWHWSFMQTHRCRLCVSVVNTTNFVPLRLQFSCTISAILQTFNLIKIILIIKLQIKLKQSWSIACIVLGPVFILASAPLKLYLAITVTSHVVSWLLFIMSSNMCKWFLKTKNHLVLKHAVVPVMIMNEMAYYSSLCFGIGGWGKELL